MERHPKTIDELARARKVNGGWAVGDTWETHYGYPTGLKNNLLKLTTRN